MEHTSPVIARFRPIGLAEMDAVRLQDRVDTKYVFPAERLDAVLEELLPHYRVLEVNGVRGTDYRSLYYDTEDLHSFHDHHNGRVRRSKVRYREYLGSGLCFLEVKRKTGRGRTDKVRRQVEAIPERMPEDHASYVREASGNDAPLHPTLWNRFTRLTLVREDRPERLTLDLGLRFHAPGTPPGDAVELGGLVVAEVKQARADRTSPFVRAMRRMGRRPGGMSKYCVGMLTLHPGLKYNNFKPVLRDLERTRNAA